MKIGDIKIEALKIMGINRGFDISISDLAEVVSDANYGDYIVNMQGAINRAIDRIVNACVLPVKSREIYAHELIQGTNNIRFDTAKIDDLYLIDRIISESGGEYDGNAPYYLEGDSLILESGKTYRVLYYPKVRAVTVDDSDHDDLWLPDHLARIIPLYIKGDLYQEDEPSAAADARNQFESVLAELKRERASNQTRVKSIVGLY